jgi:hypothetical protein
MVLAAKDLRALLEEWRQRSRDAMTKGGDAPVTPDQFNQSGKLFAPVNQVASAWGMLGPKFSAVQSGNADTLTVPEQRIDAPRDRITQQRPSSTTPRTRPSAPTASTSSRTSPDRRGCSAVYGVGVMRRMVSPPPLAVVT